MVLINGFSEQCNSYLDEFCQLFVTSGFHVIRFDNRDVGLSSDGPEGYSLKDMALLPVGVGRQYKAARADRSRSDLLRALKVPTLVIHGDQDTLIDISGGRRTAEVFPHAQFLEVAGIGHD